MVRTGRLLIVGGPSCAGKSVLIAHMQRDGGSRVYQGLGLAAVPVWRFAEAVDLTSLKEPRIERLVLHYDLFHRRSENGVFEHLHEAVDASEEVTALTLYTAQRRLIRRNAHRFLRAGAFLITRPHEARATLGRICMLRNKHRLYRDKERLWALYEAWFEALVQCGVTRHWLLDSTGPGAGEAHPCDEAGLRTLRRVVTAEDGRRARA